MQAFLLENWHACVRYILIEFEGTLFIPPNVLSNSEEDCLFYKLCKWIFQSTHIKQCLREENMNEMGWKCTRY